MINFHHEVTKLMYPDGFHKTKNHGLWKLRHKLTPNEWNTVKEHFQYYHHNDKQISNSLYHGWMTTNPVKVMLKLRTLRNET